MKKTIKIKFIGFWDGFVDSDNFIYNTLAKHYDLEFSDEPDYLFYSSFCPHSFDFVLYDCVRIYYSGENTSPDFNFCDYAIGFDNLTYEDRFLNFPLFLIYRQLPCACDKHKCVDMSLLKSKGEFANFIVGNAQGLSERTELFEKLSEYKPVASVGTYLNNREGFTVKNEEEKLSFQNSCRFSITVESVRQSGFVTEKILHAFAAKTVPIYFGNDKIDDIFNPNSFINCHNYSDFNQVVSRVKEVEENPQLWLEMVSTPCFKSPTYPEDKWADFEKFLLNIVNQPLEKAYRRPMKFHTQRYDKELKTFMSMRDNVRFRRFLVANNNFFVRLALKIFGSSADGN
ncbi:MAG: glycosyltransferase family 10 [Oscillospiraceae bacterium]